VGFLENPWCCWGEIVDGVVAKEKEERGQNIVSKKPKVAKSQKVTRRGGRLLGVNPNQATSLLCGEFDS